MIGATIGLKASAVPKTGSFLASLTRQICLAEGCAVACALGDDGKPRVDPKVARSLGDLPYDIVHLTALEPLREASQRLFLRSDGFNFRIVIVRRTAKRDFRPPMPLEELVDLGAEFLAQTGRVGLSKLPVGIEVIDVHTDGLAPDYAAQIETYARRGVASPKVAVGVVGVDEQTGQTITNVPVIGGLAAKRRMRSAWMLREGGVDAWRGAVQSAGFKISHALLGAIGGAVLSVLGVVGLGALDATEPKLYGGTITIGSVLGAAFSIWLSHIRRQAEAQALAGGLGAYVLAIAAWLFLGGELGIGTLVIGLVVALSAWAIGVSSNTISRR